MLASAGGTQQPSGSGSSSAPQTQTLFDIEQIFGGQPSSHKKVKYVYLFHNASGNVSGAKTAELTVDLGEHADARVNWEVTGRPLLPLSPPVSLPLGNIDIGKTTTVTANNIGTATVEARVRTGGFLNTKDIGSGSVAVYSAKMGPLNSAITASALHVGPEPRIYNFSGSYLASNEPLAVVGSYGSFYYVFWLNGQGFLPKDKVTLTYIWPVPGYHHSNEPWGLRAWNDNKFHQGFDTNHGCGKGNTDNCGKECKVPIVASAAGVVEKAEFDASFGNHIVIRHSDGFATLYAHLHGYLVTINQQVHQGQSIAIMGNTGNSFGAHLHFDLRTPVKNERRVNALVMYYPDDHRSGSVNPNPLFICTLHGNACKGQGVGGHNYVYNTDFNPAFFDNIDNAKWWQTTKNSW